MLTWILEPNVFGKKFVEFENAIKNAGHNIIYWCEEYSNPVNVPDTLRWLQGPAVFYGSLGVAEHINSNWFFIPGTFGALDKFNCEVYYPKVLSWRFDCDYIFSTVGDICRSTDCLAELSRPKEVFIRPTSPLKQFSGRIIDTNNITLQALDYGYYYDNLDLKILIAPVQKIFCEWRIVVIDHKVITGCSYSADTRESNYNKIINEVLEFAQKIAIDIKFSSAYILDICESEDGLKLLELNPFSGSDLYDCDYTLIVKAIGEYANNMY